MTTGNQRLQILGRLGIVLSLPVVTILGAHLVCRITWALSSTKLKTVNPRTGAVTLSERTFGNYGQGYGFWQMFADTAVSLIVIMALVLILMKVAETVPGILRYIKYGPQSTRAIRPAPTECPYDVRRGQ